MYDNILVSAGTAAAIADAGIKIVRYPGGSYADTFHWQNYTACNGSYLAAGGAFDNWINNTVLPAGAKAIITVNYGSNPTCDGGADPSEAAAWVNYANNVRGLGIKYWEIGNEVGGNGYYGGSGWEYDLHYPYNGNRNAQPALSPAAYGSNSLAFINAMKAQDPTIKCGIGFDHRSGVLQCRCVASGLQRGGLCHHPLVSGRHRCANITVAPPDSRRRFGLPFADQPVCRFTLKPGWDRGDRDRLERPWRRRRGIRCGYYPDVDRKWRLQCGLPGIAQRISCVGHSRRTQ